MIETPHRVFDSVYGYINLTDIEYKIYKTPTLQRLNDIKQMGLANILFPAASHTRLSHSLGVLHNTEKILKQISDHLTVRTEKKKITKGLIQNVRLAALLHDCCHLPLSHVGERAFNRVMENTSFGTSSKIIGGIKSNKPKFKYNSDKYHEEASAELVLYDKYIGSEIEKFNNHSKRKKTEKIDKHIIAQLITGKYTGNSLISQIIQSELDADRLDFLVRDSYFTGSHYGGIELDTLISKMIPQKDDFSESYIIVLSQDGTVVADHYLLSRHFWYSAIVNNPKMRLLDELLITIMVYFIENDFILNPWDLRDSIRKSGKRWKDNDGRHKIYKFTDSLIYEKMLDFHDKIEKKLKDAKSISDPEKFINDCIKTITDGSIPEAIYESRTLVEKKFDSRSQRYEEPFYKTLTENINIARNEIAKDLDVPKERIIFYFDSKDLSSLSENEIQGKKKEDKAIKIFNPYRRPEDSPKIKLLEETNSSLLNPLKNKTLEFRYAFFLPSKSSIKNPPPSKIRKVFLDRLEQRGIITK